MNHRVRSSRAPALKRRPLRHAAAWAMFTTLAITGCGGGGGGGNVEVAAASTATPDELATALAARPANPDIAAGAAAAAAAAIGAEPAAAAATPYSGRAWFVDSAAGTDTNAGTAAAPWKTLKRAEKQSLASGDAVLLKCGGVWRESFTLAVVNAPAGGATLGAWGTCSSANRPVVSGSDSASGAAWALSAGFGGKPVYVATWSQPVTALYWNGVPLTRARYPNYGGIGREFSLIDSMRSAKTLVARAADSAVLGSINLAGAKAFIRTNPWLVESLDVASSDAAGGVTLAAVAHFLPQAGHGYFVEGKLALLDSAGEWFHDPATNKLFVWTPSGASPASGALESAQRTVGVTVSKVADTRIDKIAFERHAQQSLYVVDAMRTAITEVSSRDAGINGILIEGKTGQSSGSSVRASTVSNAGLMGIAAASPSVQVVDNQIDNTGVAASGSGVSAGVYAKSVGAVVQGNRISNSAFAAIVLSNATGVTVSGNALVQACRRFTDCGAIYSGGAPSAAQRSLISSNAIADMVPNAEGAVGGATTLVAGIYLDEDSATHDVVNNMISRVGVGINLHNSANHTVQSNQVWLVERASVRVHDSSGTDKVRGNVVQDNQLFASSHLLPSVPVTTAPTGQQIYAQEWLHNSDATLMFGGGNPNIVRRNVAATMSMPSAIRWSLLGGTQHRVLDAAQWSALAAGETARSAYAARPFIVAPAGANLVANGSFLSPGAGWLFWSPFPAAGGTITFGTCNPGCGDFSPGSTSDFLMSNSFRMSSAAGANLYHLRLRAQGFAAGGAVTMAVNRDGGDWAQLGLVLMDQPINNVGETSIEALFNATSVSV